MPGLPFAHLNLRQNPFGELAPEDRAALAVVDLGPLLAWLRPPGRALQLLGGHGRGKTTHLLALAAAVPGSSYVRAWRDRPLRPRPSALLLLDEADSARPWQRHQTLRASARVVLSTHRDLSLVLRLAGLEVRTHRVGGPDPQHLSQVFRGRIEHCRRGPGPVPTVRPSLVRSLVRRHGDDVRAMEHELYERFQTLSGPHPLEE